MANPFGKNSTEIDQAEHISPIKTGDNIEAKRIAGYVWNAGTSEWERMTQPSITTGDITIEGVAAYADSGDVPKAGLVDGDRHVQVDVLTMPPVTVDPPVGGATEAEQEAQTALLTTIEANQLPDGHNVTVDNASLAITAAALPLPSGAAVASNQQTDALTDAELRATPVVVDLGANNDVTVSGVSTSAKQDTIIGHLDGVEGLLTTIDGDTGTLAATVISNKVQVDVISVPTTTVQATDLDIRNLTATDVVTANLSATDNQVLDDIDAVLDTIKVDTEAIETAVEAIQAAQLPDGHNVTIDNPGDIGGGTQYTEGDTAATPTGTVAMWRDSSDDSILSVSDENPLPVSASIDTTGLATDTKQDAQTALLTSIEGNQLPDGHNVTVDNASLAVTGTVTANLGTLNGAATAANQQTDALTDTELRATPVVVDLGANNDVTVTGNVAVTNAGLTELAAAVNGSSQMDVNIAAGNITGFATSAKQDTIIGHLDGVESTLTTIDGRVDGVEALLTTIDADTSNLSVVGGGTEASAIRVTIANNSTGVLSVDDNGSTLSVDDGGGVLTVDGTVTANLSATDNAVLDSIDEAVSSKQITSIGHGVTTVTTAGTDVALAGSTACKRVTIMAQTDNTGVMAVGGSGVDATIATGTGILLFPGDAYELDIDNLADVFIDSSVNGEGVRYTWFN